MVTLPVVGEDLTDAEQDSVEQSIQELESCGMKVIKIINYKGGSTKFIASIVNGISQYEARRKLENSGWSMGPPYFSKGSIIGFKISKIQSSTNSNSWGGS